MLYRAAVVTLVAMVAAAGSDARSTRDPDALVVHEWGTFTSIAGENGEAVDWLPLQGSDDLPCFVERFRRYRGKGFSAAPCAWKRRCSISAPRETTVDVSVRFPGGLITEWFPRAAVTPAEPLPTTGWRGRDLPAARNGRAYASCRAAVKTSRPRAASSHYYLARRTDAAPVEVAGAREKFLFYRGVADIRVPIAAIPRPTAASAWRAGTPRRSAR